MPTYPRDVLRPDATGRLEVQVNWDPHGGWRVDALRNGRIVASRHCDDWHRVERARDALAAELENAPAGSAMAHAR